MGFESLLYRHQGIQIEIGPLTRPAYLNKLLFSDGLTGIREDRHAAYCAIPLTSAPEKLQPDMVKRQNNLLGILKDAGITGYDPKTAPFSPDAGLKFTPEEVSRVDTGKLAGARFFTLLDLLPSTGVGIEERVAYDYNRIAVILHDKNIRTTRMQTNRSIHLSYDNLEEQREDLIAVFRLLQNFTPGTGFENGKPVLLGFCGNKAYNLEKLIYQIFPDLKYEYKPDIPAIKLLAANPKILE